MTLDDLIAEYGSGDPYRAPVPKPAKIAALDRFLKKANEATRRALVEALCRVDPVSWARIKCGIHLDPWQQTLARGTRDTMALCSRQAGKSSAAAVTAAWHVCTKPDYTAVCVSPTMRQSGQLARYVKSAI